MEIEDITITKREILVCIAATLILLGIGFPIIAAIQNSINEKNEKYFKALKINNDTEQFQYAINTNLGQVMAYGKVEAVDGSKIEDLENRYFYIKKEKEKYTRHTRQVAHERKVGNTTETYYTTEVYYTWDYEGKEEWKTKRFRFLNVEFDYGTINFNNTEYLTTIQTDSTTRYVYYIIPFEFAGTLSTDITNNTITNNQFFYNKKIEKIIEEKKAEINTTKIIFWFLWIFFIILLDFGYVGLDNNYLED